MTRLTRSPIRRISHMPKAPHGNMANLRRCMMAYDWRRLSPVFGWRRSYFSGGFIPARRDVITRKRPQ